MKPELECPSEAGLDQFFASRSPLAALSENGDAFRSSTADAGRKAGAQLVHTTEADATILVVARPRDFEGFASSLVEELERSGRSVRIACLWLGSSRLRSDECSTISQVMRWFIEDDHADADHVIVAAAVLDHPAAITTSALWASHKTQGATLTIASDLAEGTKLHKTLTELSMCLGEKPWHVVLRVETSPSRFDQMNLLRLVAENDDQAHEPPFVSLRMSLHAERRLAESPRSGSFKNPIPKG